MTGSTGQLLSEFASTLALELLSLLPKLVIAVLAIIIAFLVARFVGEGIRRLLKMADIDDMIKRYSGITLPISLASVIMAIFYIGVVLALLYGLINLFLGEAYVEVANSILIYGARVISVIFLAIILFAAFSSVIERIRVESRMKGYLFFIVMLLLTAMLIDVTALSEPVKQSLYTGLAIGIGASLAVFSIWFFFHEYFDEMLKQRETRKQSRK